MVLCGSAFGEMRRLIDGPAPLRGRASLELVVQPFDFRTAAAFWGLESNVDVAFTHHSYVGGTPAYRVLAAGDVPACGDLDTWVIRRLLDPSSSLYGEGRVVVAEDPQLGDQQRYWGLLTAIADGARRWSDLESVLGHSRGSLQHALNVVIEAGWDERLEDPLRANRPIYVLSEPMIRFQRIVIEPNQQRLMARRAADVWRDARPLVASRIHGPHLEALARDWLVRFASANTVGGSLASVGPANLEPRRGAPEQLDLAGVETTRRGSSELLFVGEVKATESRVGESELARLDRVIERLDRPGARRILVSRSGFTTELERLAARRGDIELIDLHRLHHGD